MPHEPQGAAAANRFAPWSRWYETTLGVWESLRAGGNRDVGADPFAVYDQWLEAVERQWAWTQLRPVDPAHPAAFFRQWIEAMRSLYTKAAETGSDPAALAAQWFEMLKSFAARMTPSDGRANDPLAIFRAWCNAADVSPPVLGEPIGSEASPEAAGRFADLYTTMTTAVSRATEQYYRNLEIPTRSDVTRAVERAAQLENKLERIDEAVGALRGRSDVGSPTAAADLDERLKRLENKLDRLLASAERQDADRDPGVQAATTVGAAAENPGSAT